LRATISSRAFPPSLPPTLPTYDAQSLEDNFTCFPSVL
jgi:hypothetical protein